MELNFDELESVSISNLCPLSEQYCPQCGADMKEVDRLNEGGTMFIWYECTEPNCNGSWIEKISRY
jgi:hypothetical protein